MVKIDGEERMPSNIKTVFGNMSVNSYIEEVNRMAMLDIFMHHRSDVVFNLIEQTYNRTMDWYSTVQFSFQQMLEEASPNLKHDFKESKQGEKT